MRSAALALALLLTPLLQAQQADATPQVIERLFKPPDNPVAPTGLASTRDLGTIEGVVLKSTTGQPLRRALITTQKMGANDSPHTARTDSGGRFVLRNLEPGEYNLWVNRDGYLGMGYGQEVPNGPGKLLKLAPGEQKKGVVFRLIPTGAVIGRVYDEDGEPISGVSVQAMRFTFFNGRRQLNPAMGTSTNDLGEYRLGGLPPDKYYLAATYNQPDPGGEGAPEAYAPAYYPGTNDPDGAAQGRGTGRRRNARGFQPRARARRARARPDRQRHAQPARNRRKHYAGQTADRGAQLPRAAHRQPASRRLRDTQCSARLLHSHGAVVG